MARCSFSEADGNAGFRFAASQVFVYTRDSSATDFELMLPPVPAIQHAAHVAHDTSTLFYPCRSVSFLRLQLFFGYSGNSPNTSHAWRPKELRACRQEEKT